MFNNIYKYRCVKRNIFTQFLSLNFNSFKFVFTLIAVYQLDMI